MSTAQLTPLDSIELRTISLPFRSPFETSLGLQNSKEALILILEKEGLIAYGECVAGTSPSYSEETISSAQHIISQFLVPALLTKEFVNPEEFLNSTRTIRGNNMAIASVEMSLWDLMGKLKQQPLSQLLGGIKSEVQVGVSIGIQPSIQRLIQKVDLHLAEGYKRIKVKIRRDFDIEPLKAIRKQFPDAPLQADANSAYTLEDTQLLKQLDSLNMILIEQPLGPDDILDHSKLQKELATPICLDESIRTVDDARKAIELQACRIVNVKAGRLRGLQRSKQVHDLCVKHDTPVWCGGMYETGIGRAYNIALASLPGFTLPGDISASKYYFLRDIITEEFELTDQGTIKVPDGPGIGIHVDQKRLDSCTITKKKIEK